MNLLDNMKNLTRFLDSLYAKDIIILVKTEQDYNSFLKNIRKDMYGRMDFDKYPVRFIRDMKYYVPDLTIIFSCYLSQENKIVIDDLSQDKVTKINFHFSNWENFQSVYKDVFLSWANKFKKPHEEESSEFTWCIPPDDPTNPNYNKWMDEWVKLCDENPKIVENVLSEEHKAIYAEQRRKRNEV